MKKWNNKEEDVLEWKDPTDIPEQETEFGTVENNEPGEIGFNTGNDPIEMSMEEGEKIVYGSSFASKGGELGDESEDNNDLPSQLKKTGNRYDPTLSSGEIIEGEAENEELKQGIHIASADEIGMAYGPDNYVNNESDSPSFDEE